MILKKNIMYVGLAIIWVSIYLLGQNQIDVGYIYVVFATGMVLYGYGISLWNSSDFSYTGFEMSLNLIGAILGPPMLLVLWSQVR